MPHLKNAKGLKTRHLANKRKIVDSRIKYDQKTGNEIVQPIYESAGSCFEEEPPDEIELSIRILEKYEKRGFATLENKQIKHFPGGPNGTHGRKLDPWRRDKIHTAFWCDKITFHCVHHGDVVYDVVHCPGKYYVVDDVPVTEETIDRYGEECYVDWVFHARRVKG